MSRPEFVIPKPIVVLRVYYNAKTKRCLFKTNKLENSEHPFITVNVETYNSIDMCNNFQVVDGIISRIRSLSRFKRIEINPEGRFKTTKNNMIFIVTDNNNYNVDCWETVIHD